MTDWIDAAFVRGGTSKGLFFTADALPELPASGASPGSATAAGASRGSAADAGNPAGASPGSATAAWDRIFCAALGSPDEFGRQLDGMGGGISSLSKVMVVRASDRDGFDLDYTFAQVSVAEASVDYSGNCGNLSSGVVPFALAAGLIESRDGHRVFRLFNTNTGKRVDVGLSVVGGQAAVDGDFVLTGVSGTGAPIELLYPDPAGSRTSGLLPTGTPVDTITVGDPVMGERSVEVSLVDASLPVVIVDAGSVGLRGDESPDEIDADVGAVGLIEEIRRIAAVRMGLCDTPESAPQVVPKVALVAPPTPTRLLDGTILGAEESDIVVRMISMGQAHRAVPGTGAMCLAAAALVPDSIVDRIAAGSASSAPTSSGSAGPGSSPEPTRRDPENSGATSSEPSGTPERERSSSVRLATPSGVVTAGATWDEARATVTRTSLFRTARILMKGQVAIRS